jgi:hypothetical protein
MQKIKFTNFTKIHLILILFLTCYIISYKIFPIKNIDKITTNYYSYALAGTVQLLLDDNKYIKILSCYPENDIIKIGIESNIPVDINNTDINLLFDFIDDNGNKANFTATDVFCNNSHESPQYQWLIYGNLSIISKPIRLNLVYNKYKIPIIFSRNIFNMSEYEDIKIAVFTQYIDNLLQIILVPTTNNKNISVIKFIKESITLYDKNGNIYSQLSKNGSSNNFYFEAKLTDQLYLDISSVNILNNQVSDIPYSLQGNWRIMIK